MYIKMNSEPRSMLPFPLLSPLLGDYLTSVGFDDPPALQELRRQMATHGQCHMMADPDVGAFLAFMVRLIQPKRILEIGTFAGYSSLSMALALSEGAHITTLDQDPTVTQIAQQAWVQNGVDHQITFRLGRALDSLADLLDHDQSYDLIFIDADKKMYDQYLEYAWRLRTPRGLVILDNTLWGGAVADVHTPLPPDDRATCEVLRSLNFKLHNDSRFQSHLLPIGDGVTLVMGR